MEQFGFPIAADDLLRALDAADDAVYVTDRGGTILFANRAVAALLDTDPSRIVGSHTRLFRSGLMSPEYYERLWRTILDGHVWRERITNRRASGTLYEATQTITPVRDHTGSVTHFIAVQRDISKNRNLENEDGQVAAQLADIVEHRTLLLQELNHRVKNDLEIARALLVMRTAEITDAVARSAITDASERLAHASGMYDLLSVHAREDRVLLGDFLAQLQHAWTSSRHVGATIDLADGDDTLTVPSTLALSVGLIVHELITNAEKYATASGRPAHVYITRDGEMLHCTVRDEGSGYPTDVLEGRRTGLGLSLVETLVRRMSGHLAMCNDGGAVTEIAVQIPA